MFLSKTKSIIKFEFLSLRELLNVYCFYINIILMGSFFFYIILLNNNLNNHDTEGGMKKIKEN